MIWVKSLWNKYNFCFVRMHITCVSNYLLLHFYYCTFLLLQSERQYLNWQHITFENVVFALQWHWLDSILNCHYSTNSISYSSFDIQNIWCAKVIATHNMDSNILDCSMGSKNQVDDKLSLEIVAVASKFVNHKVKSVLIGFVFVFKFNGEWLWRKGKFHY